MRFLLYLMNFWRHDIICSSYWWVLHSVIRLFQAKFKYDKYRFWLTAVRKPLSKLGRRPFQLKSKSTNCLEVSTISVSKFRQSSLIEAFTRLSFRKYELFLMALTISRVRSVLILQLMILSSSRFFEKGLCSKPLIRVTDFWSKVFLDTTNCLNSS